MISTTIMIHSFNTLVKPQCNSEIFVNSRRELISIDILFYLLIETECMSIDGIVLLRRSWVKLVVLCYRNMTLECWGLWGETPGKAMNIHGLWLRRVIDLPGGGCSYNYRITFSGYGFFVIDIVRQHHEYACFMTEWGYWNTWENCGVDNYMFT